MSLLLTFLAVLAILFIVPVVVYGIFSAFFALKQPENMTRFLAGVLIQKIGTTIGFIWLYRLGVFEGTWPLYALAWFVMFAITEIGQAMTPSYTAKEAAAGIISEAAYFPAAAFAMAWILG